MKISLILLLFSHSIVSDSLWPHGLWHTKLPCPSPSPGACSNSCPVSWWCRPTISSSVALFSSCPQSFPVSGFFFFFPMSWLFTSHAQSIGASASASVLSVNIQDWFPLGLTGFHDKNEQKGLEWWLQTQDWIPMKLNIVLKIPKGLFLDFLFLNISTLLYAIHH